MATGYTAVPAAGLIISCKFLVRTREAAYRGLTRGASPAPLLRFSQGRAVQTSKLRRSNSVLLGSGYGDVFGVLPCRTAKRPLRG